MEVVGALASSLQIVSQCAQVTMTIIKWHKAVNNIDVTVASFAKEVETLGSTYQILQESLESHLTADDAKDTDRDVGARLWTRLSLTLKDGKSTLDAITNVLIHIEASNKSLISRSSKRLESMFKHLRKSLASGDLVRLREQIIVFNSSLQMTIPMISLNIQLRQQEVTTAQQLHVNDNLSSLRESIDTLCQLMTSLTQTDTWEGSTLHSITMIEGKWRDNLKEYVGSAKEFLIDATATATTLSIAGASCVGGARPTNEESAVRRGSAWAPLTEQQFSGISRFVNELPDETGSGTPETSEVLSSSDIQPETLYDSEDDDTELQILQQLLQNGQARLCDENYIQAENDFQAAMKLLQENEFSSRNACTIPDISLLLGECLVKQEKLDEAIDLLTPLASPSVAQNGSPRLSGQSLALPPGHGSDRGQALTANQLLGEVYLKKEDGGRAVKHALKAYKGRKKLLGENHTNTIHSVHLVINAYKASGDTSMADAYYQRFLEPVQHASEHVASSPNADTSTIRANTHDAVAIGNSPPDRPRRTTFNFPGFRRSERQDLNITSVPLPVEARTLGQQPVLRAEDPKILSTSPHDISFLRSTLNEMSDDIPSRQQSMDSTNVRPVLSRGKSGSDVSEHNFNHQRTQSVLSKAPTLFATMSRSGMERVFHEVSSLSKEGKTSKAVDKGVQFLQNYDPAAAIFIHRASELKENIKKSKGLGLAGTGYGFSPLHLFCSLRYQPLIEIEILLQLGANVQAVAYKAGYGKLDPFTSLNLAVERNHLSVVRLLLSHGATWQSTLMKRGSRYNADRDPPHPLLQACQKGFVQIMEALLEFKLELNEDNFPQTSWHGNSLLHEACFRCDVPMVDSLIRYAKTCGILHQDTYTYVGTPGQQDAFGMTPIMYAIDMRDKKDMKLTEHKTRHRIECLKLLLGDECEYPNVPEMDGGAVDFDHMRRGSVSQKMAANLYVEDKKGNTVFWYADESRGGDEELKLYLNEQSRKSQLIEI